MSIAPDSPWPFTNPTPQPNMQPTTTLRQVVDLATRHTPTTLTQAEDMLATVRDAFALPKASAIGSDSQQHTQALRADMATARTLAKAMKAPTSPARAALTKATRKPAMPSTVPVASADRNAAARAALWAEYQSLPAGSARQEFFKKHRATLWHAAREVKI